jgi:DNA-binding winged helix-turn-helix (wHTH) protein
MGTQTRRFYEFGPFQLDAGERRLLRDGSVIPLTAKVFDILLVLVQSGGQTLEKGELLQKLWPDTFVDVSMKATSLRTSRCSERRGAIARLTPDI